MILGLYRLMRASGSSSIDVFEWQRADVMKKRLPNNPQWCEFASPKAKLLFSGWDLAHAVVKTDFLVERNLILPGIGFLLQMDQVLDFPPPSNLRHAPGAANVLNDFTQTSVTGPVGQGLSMLFAHSRGYAFVGHLGSDAAVRAYQSSQVRNKKGRAEKCAYGPSKPLDEESDAAR